MTHHNSANWEISLYKVNLRIRIDFEFGYKENLIEVILYKDKFPFWPQFFISLHNTIPFCQDFSKITWKNLEDLPLDKDYSFYANKINEYIDLAKKEL